MNKRLFLSLLLLFTVVSLQSQVTVSGTVTEDETGYALIGVSIYEKGAPNATVTDVSGEYEINLESEESILVFSYIGFSTQEVRVGERGVLNIVMEQDVARLDEVVVIGYGTQKKKEVTGAISKVAAEELDNMPVVRVEQSLQGRTSGVRVTSGSGQPGEGATVRIRGTSSINGSDPLYVVDGVIIGGGIDYLNQSDIESIEVLKDAASASIYGARSAGGVVLITTKKGKKDQMAVNYNAYYGVQNPWKKMAVLNATEYATLMNESAAAAPDSIASGIIYEDPQSLGEGTDWQDAVFNDNAPMQNHSISISAGSKVSTYYASFGFFDQSGIVSEDRSRYQRFTTRFNSSHEINKFLKFGNTLSYSRIKSVGVSTNSEFGSPLGRALNIDPITPVIETDEEVLNTTSFTAFPAVKNENGDFYGISEIVTSEVLNPVAALAIENGYGWSDKIVGNVFGELTFFEGLKFRSSIGTDLAFWGDEGFAPVYYLNGTNRNDLTRYNRSQNRGLYYIWENTLSYNKEFNLHKLGLVVGTVAEKNRGQGISGSVQDIPVDNIEDASLAFTTTPESQAFGGFEYLNTNASYLGRINYGFNEKYLVSAALRVDGSSRFGSNNKFGYFPSASLGWVVTEEGFLTKNPIINFLKIRGSWGINGNDNAGDFAYVARVGGGRNYTFGLDENLTNGTSPLFIANPDLRWEASAQTNIGFDAKIFKKVSVTFDLFDKVTTDMLLGIGVPDYVGNDGPIGNLAEMSNKGFELEVGYEHNFNKLNVDVSGNISYVENIVTSLGPDKEHLPGLTFSPQALEVSRITEGLPIGHFYGYQTDGIFQNQAEVDAYVNADGGLMQEFAAPGDMKFIDVDGDGFLTPDDRTMIGDPTPSWTYGVNLGLDWKGFDILCFGQGVWGNEIFKATRRFDLQTANMTADALDRWTGEGSTNEYPRLILNDPNKNFSRSSDFYVESGAYFRIKTLQIGYSLPDFILENIGMKNLRFYVSGNNLLTITEYSGFDPEIGGGSFGVDRGIYPQPRFYLVGLSADF